MLAKSSRFVNITIKYEYLHNDNFAEKMLAKSSRFVTSNLEKAFFAWGLTVARHPFPVIIIALPPSS